VETGEGRNARLSLPGEISLHQRVAEAPWRCVYMMPSWVMALAWLSLFKNDRIGGAEDLFSYLFGISPPDWVS